MSNNDVQEQNVKDCKDFSNENLHCWLFVLLWQYWAKIYLFIYLFLWTAPKTHPAICNNTMQLPALMKFSFYYSKHKNSY